MNSRTAPKDSSNPISLHLNSMDRSEDAIDLAQYWRTILRYKWSILIITLLCTLVGSLLVLSATPIYRANATIQADPTQPSANPREQYVNTALVLLFYETQYEIIRSRAVAEAVVDKLNLLEQYKNKANGETSSDRKSPFNVIRTWMPLLYENQSTYQPTDEELRVKIAQNIQSNLTVKGGKQSQIIVISYDSSDANEASRIVNAVADAYIEFGLASRLGEIEKTAEWLSDQLSNLKNNLDVSELALRKYRQETGLVESSQQARITSTQLQTLNTELVRAQTRKSEAEIRYLQVNELRNQPGNHRSISAVLNSKTIQDMVREETRLKRKVEELSERYGEKHPKMIAANSDFASAENNLQREINKIADSIEKEYRSASVQVSNINTLIRKQKSELASLQGDNFALANLERDVENNRRIYESFTAQLMEADVSGNYDASNIRIIDSATTPNAPYKPNKKLYLGLSVVLGSILGIALSFLRNSLDSTFKTPDTIERELNTAYLGLTQYIKNTGASVLPEQQYLTDSRTTFAESINNIRTGLLFSRIDNPPQSILITSATGSEGKSTLAINLAAAFSQLDRTLLLEVDLRKPSLSRYMKTKKRQGLCDWVTGQAKLTELLNQADSSSNNLHVMTCGALPPNPLELVSSARFKKALDTLRSHYKFIVMDGPPILPVSDSLVLGHISDATILTVQAEKTSISAAREALGQLQKVGVHVAGAVLSQAEPHRMGYYGDHYYSGKYYGDEEIQYAPEETRA